MRCPKCGFFSFDHLESCKKCHKFIGDLSSEFQGTVFEAQAPSYLQKLYSRQAVAPPVQETAGGGDITSSDEGDIVLELADDDSDGLQIQEEISMETAPAAEERELVVDMEAFGEVSPREEFSLDLPEQNEESSDILPKLDFGDLDISDLAPPSDEQAFPPEFEEKLQFEEMEPVAAMEVSADVEPVAALSPAPAPPSAPRPASGKSSGLEDLNFNGLDLDAPAKLMPGSAAGKRYLPSVKTGTALDKFDIDLGDLFTEGKK